ncbi:MAG: hypothetical protein VX519_05210 [Myxococcota bacterium]|nr:hypothetical protein [Myxococcota bacterium]
MANDDNELDRTLEELSRKAKGTLRLLLGSNVGGTEEDEAPDVVLTPEVDAALEGAVHLVGGWLKDVGEDLQRQGGVEHPKPLDEEGWSPLAVGARAFGEGIRVVGVEMVNGFTGGEE